MAMVFGTVDGFSPPQRLYGWVTADDGDTNRKVEVVVKRHGKEVGSCIADQSRADLAAIGDGNVAYDFNLEVPLSPDELVDGGLTIEAWRGTEWLGPIPLGRHMYRELVQATVQAQITVLANLISIVGLNDIDHAASETLQLYPETVYQIYSSLLKAVDEAPPIAPLQPQITASKPNAIAVLKRFESLGFNCEFGLVQRHYGVEGIGLLRWGSFSNGLSGLLHALETRFTGVGIDLSYHVNGAEIISTDEKLKLVFHTDRDVGQVDPQTVLRNERVRIPFLARNFLEDIEAGEKVFVYQDGGKSSIAEAEKLVAALRRIGDATLLWVTPARSRQQIGTVQLVSPNLICGFIDRFSPAHNVHEYCSFDAWLTICNNTLNLIFAAGHFREGAFSHRG